MPSLHITRAYAVLACAAQAAGCGAQRSSPVEAREAPTVEVKTAPLGPSDHSPTEARGSMKPNAMSGVWNESGRTVFVLALGDRGVITFHDSFDDHDGARNCACQWHGKIHAGVLSATSDDLPPVQVQVNDGKLLIAPESGLARCCFDVDDEHFSPMPRATGNRTPPAHCITRAVTTIFVEDAQTIPVGSRLWHLRDEEDGSYAAALVNGDAIVGRGERRPCD